MSRSRLTDTCECSYEPRRPPAEPYGVIYTGADALRAFYRCQHCGAEWTCNWSATGAGWPPLIPDANRDEGVPVLEHLQ